MFGSSKNPITETSSPVTPVDHKSSGVSTVKKTPDMWAGFWQAFWLSTQAALSEALASGIQSDFNHHPQRPEKTNKLMEKELTTDLKNYVNRGAFLFYTINNGATVRVNEWSCYSEPSYNPVIAVIDTIEVNDCDSEENFNSCLRAVEDACKDENFPPTLKIRLDVLIASIRNVETKVFEKWRKETSGDAEEAIQLALTNLVKKTMEKIEADKRSENDDRRSSYSSLTSSEADESVMTPVSVRRQSSSPFVSSSAPVDSEGAIRQRKIMPYLLQIQQLNNQLFQSLRDKASVSRYVRILEGFAVHDRRVSALDKIVQSFPSLDGARDQQKSTALTALTLAKDALTGKWTIDRYIRQRNGEPVSEGAVYTPRELENLHEAMQSDVHESLKTLYGFSKTGQLTIADVESKFWFHPFGKTEKQLAIEEYLTAENENAQQSRLAAQQEFNRVVRACSKQQSKKSGCLQLCENVRAIEEDISQSCLELSKVSDRQYIENMRAALNQLYPEEQSDRQGFERIGVDESDILLQRIKKASTYWGVFGGTWSVEYKTAKALIDALDRIPTHKDDIAAKASAFISVWRKKKLSNDDLQQQLNISQLEASVQDVGSKGLVVMMAEQEKLIAKKTEASKQLSESYTVGSGFPAITQPAASHCDYLIAKIYSSRPGELVVSYSEIAKGVIFSSRNEQKNSEVENLREKLLPLFDHKNPNIYFVLLLLGVELARLEANSSSVAYRKILKRLSVNLFTNLSAYTTDLAELDGCSDARWLTAFLPATFQLQMSPETTEHFQDIQELFQIISPSSKNMSSSPISVSSVGSMSPKSPEKQAILELNSSSEAIDEICFSDSTNTKLKELALQHAAVIAFRKGSKFANRYKELTQLLDENLRNHSNVSKSVILAYTLSQWYATTDRGQAALQYLSCSKPYYEMHAVLKSMMNGASDVSALETVTLFNPGNDNEAGRKALHDLFLAIKAIFPAAFTCKPGVSSEVSDAKLSNNRSTTFSGGADRQNSAKANKFVSAY